MNPNTLTEIIKEREKEIEDLWHGTNTADDYKSLIRLTLTAVLEHLVAEIENTNEHCSVLDKFITYLKEAIAELTSEK